MSFNENCEVFGNSQINNYSKHLNMGVALGNPAHAPFCLCGMPVTLAWGQQPIIRKLPVDHGQVTGRL